MVVPAVNNPVKRAPIASSADYMSIKMVVPKVKIDLNEEDSLLINLFRLWSEVKM